MRTPVDLGTGNADLGRAQGRIELELLAGFALRCDGTALTLPPGAERLLAYVALHDRPVQRGQVAATLWLDALEARCAANLRSALWRLRQAHHDLLQVSLSHLGLSPGVTVDARESVGRAQRLLSGDIELPCAAHALVGQLAADLLPDWYDDWVILWRERWRQLRLHALEALALRLAAARRFGEAVEAALAAVAGEPLRESAHRCLIQVHLAEGNRAEALRAYEQLDGLLREELGVRPSGELRRLVGGLAAARQEVTLP
jgi:DNA-binding SARP family transcriptional activator